MLHVTMQMRLYLKPKLLGFSPLRSTCPYAFRLVVTRSGITPASLGIVYLIPSRCPPNSMSL